MNDDLEIELEKTLDLLTKCNKRLENISKQLGLNAKGTHGYIYTEIVDKIEELKRNLKIKDEYLKLIIGIGFDYDGYYDNAENLRNLVDELVDLAEKAINNDDKSCIYDGFIEGGTPRNILREVIDEKEGK